MLIGSLVLYSRRNAVGIRLLGLPTASAALHYPGVGKMHHAEVIVALFHDGERSMKHDMACRKFAHFQEVGHAFLRPKFTLFTV